MGKELEIKLRAQYAQQLKKIREAFPEAVFHRIKMQTLYYDTPSRELQKRRWTLRRRLENGKSIVCLKTLTQQAGGFSSRGEWEKASEEITAAGLIEQGAPLELAQLLEEGLVQTCGAAFTRMAAELRLLDASRCELALDEGVLLGKTTQVPFCEVELELKDGQPEQMRMLALRLQEEFCLFPEPKSKFMRAAALL